MIIVKLKGGLGNQVFQYAAGLAVASRRDQKLKIDTTGYDDPRVINSDIPRKYGLFAFNISGSIATAEEVRKARNPFGIFSKALRFFSQKFLRRYYLDYHPEFFKKNHKYVEGFFQSEKNFASVKEKVIREFTLKKEFESDVFLAEKNKVYKIKSVSVHIRRGDYVNDKVTNDYWGTCSKEYYKEAIDLIRSKIEAPIFCFFSDDIEWVKKEFGEQPDFKYISNSSLKDYEELMLMSLCAHNITANSSFSWWGAYLNQNPSKIIIAPKKWVIRNYGLHPNIIPLSWIRI